MKIEKPTPLVYAGWTPESWLTRLRYMESVCDLPEHAEHYRAWADKLEAAIKAGKDRKAIQEMTV